MIIIKPWNKDVQFSFRLKAEAAKKLHDLAKKNGVTVSEIIRQIIDKSV